jgi:PAS domain S-box-containing protein
MLRAVTSGFLAAPNPCGAETVPCCIGIGVNLDIDELKQAELYLAEGQRIAHTGSWAFNTDGFEHWSSELFKIHGLDPSGNAPNVSEYLALIHPEDREFVSEEIEKIAAERTGFDFTKRIVRPDGEIRRVRCVGVPLRYGEHFRGFVGTGVDVTEREQLIEEMQETEAELRQMLDFAPQLVGVYGQNRERLYVNRIALDYAGLSIEEWQQTQERHMFVHRMTGCGTGIILIVLAPLDRVMSWSYGCARAMEATAGFLFGQIPSSMTRDRSGVGM